MRTKPAISVWVVLSTVLATAAAPAPSRTKTVGEPGDERDARHHDPSRRSPARRGGRPRSPRRRRGSPARAAARRASPPRSGRRGTRPGASRPSLRRRTARAPGRPGARGPARAAARRRRAPARRRPCSLSHARAPTPTAAAPNTIAANGSSQASRSNPLVFGVESTCGPSSATKWSSIWFSVQPARSFARMNAFICCASGELDSSSGSWQVVQTRPASTCAWVGCLLSCDRKAIASPKTRATIASTAANGFKVSFFLTGSRSARARSSRCGSRGRAAWPSPGR